MARRGAGAGEGEHARGEDRVRRMRNRALVTGVFTILLVKLMLEVNNLNNHKFKRTGLVQACTGPAGGGAAGSSAGDGQHGWHEHARHEDREEIGAARAAQAPEAAPEGLQQLQATKKGGAAEFRRILDGAGKI